MSAFDFTHCTHDDRAIARRYIGDLLRPADLVVTTDDSVPYLWRWHVLPRLSGEDQFGGHVYFHIQTSSDPERPLHDHPWPNMSVILAGGYDETLQRTFGQQRGMAMLYQRRKGNVVFREAAWLHRLELPPSIAYTMTQFTTGPYERKWGFQIGSRWYPHDQCSKNIGTKSIFVYPEGSQAA